MTRKASRLGHAIGLSALLAGSMTAPPAAAEPYIRAGGGIDWSQSSSFFDHDCAARQPPALFGCVIGEGGVPIGARGDFGSSASIDLGAGYRILPGFRVEALATHRPDFGFSGNANFLSTPQPQPVSAKLRSTTGMVVGYLDLVELGLPAIGPLEPFVGAGLGLTRHRLSSVTYAFPGFGPGASTVIQGGSQTTFSYMLTAGTALRISEQLTIDLAYRYADLGTVRSDAGPALITRPAFATTLNIAGTEADLTTHGITASLRYQF